MSEAVRERKSGIYKITSPSGKIYIGQSVDIDTRFSKYRSLGCPGQIRLFLSFRKYGVKSHKFEILENVSGEVAMVERERYWQDYYASTGERGLNCKLVTVSGHAGRHSEETRKRMSESAKGRYPSLEAKQKMRDARLGKPMPEEQRLKMIGRKLSDETKEKMRQRMRGNQYTKGMTPVNARRVICTETGIVYDKIQDAADSLGIKRTTLGAMLRGQSKNRTTMRYA